MYNSKNFIDFILFLSSTAKDKHAYQNEKKNC